MIPVEIPARRPLVYLQSIEDARICFVCLPVLAIDERFRLHLSDEERAAILFPEDMIPEIGVDVLCLGLLIPADRTVQSNLGAPIVINLHNGRGVQCVPREGSRLRFPAWGERAMGDTVLVLRRKAGEAIVIGEGVEISVIEISPTPGEAGGDGAAGSHGNQERNDPRGHR